MSHPTPSFLLPIPDIQPSRDINFKIRTVGHVLALSCTRSSALLSYGNASLRLDLSLCTHGAADADARAGWPNYRANSSSTRSVYPPRLKYLVMCLGYLDPESQTSQPPSTCTWEQQATTSSPIPPPYPHCILRVLLLNELDAHFDIHLWTNAARLRSAFEYKTRATSGAEAKNRLLRGADMIQSASTRADVDVIQLSD